MRRVSLVIAFIEFFVLKRAECLLRRLVASAINSRMVNMAWQIIRTIAMSSVNANESHHGCINQ